MRYVSAGAMAVLVVVANIVLAVSCRSTPPPPKLDEFPSRMTEFHPAEYVATVHLEEGRYPDLFGPPSFAVWVNSELANLKKQKAGEAGETIDPRLESEAATISNNFLVIECHIESAFGDTSIAYDSVGFRGIEVYLATPDGRVVRPVQTVISPELEKEQKGALKLFRRTNLVIFRMRDLWVGRPTIEPSAPSIRLVLDGYNSKYYFEWPQAAAEQSGIRMPTKEQVLFATRLGFTELYSRIMLLFHITQ